MSRTVAVTSIVGGLMAGASAALSQSQTPPSPRLGTAALRAALFDAIIERTERREAFSPVKEASLGFVAIEAMRALREEVVGAASEAELFYALVRLSNARRDHHLSVGVVPGGLAPPATPALRAPIRVLADFSNLEAPAFFVSAVADSNGLSATTSPSVGDLIVGINGQSIQDYIETFTPYVVHSSIHGLWWDMAAALPVRSASVPPWLYGETLDLELEHESGARRRVSLPYVDPRSLDLPAAEQPPYPGFRTVMDTMTFRLLLPDDERSIALLQWLDFEDELIGDVADLMAFAERERLLDHTLIIDVTEGSGGSRGAYAIQRLVSRPFRTTFGNIRLSDAAAEFIEARLGQGLVEDAPDLFGLNESGSWLLEWLRTDATEALERGDEYTAPVPFKLAHLPRGSDGILQPAPVHFRGPIALIVGPQGGSHLDQFVAMFADNDLAHTVGMPAGGYSNTWEASEVLTFPGTDRPVVEFMWNLGHTFRPNGEILEGNPVMPRNYLPLTRENFRTYHHLLLNAALEGLGVDLVAPAR